MRNCLDEGLVYFLSEKLKEERALQLQGSVGIYWNSVEAGCGLAPLFRSFSLAVGRNTIFFSSLQFSSSIPIL
jgi:hypothetical protein